MLWRRHFDVDFAAQRCHIVAMQRETFAEKEEERERERGEGSLRECFNLYFIA